MSGLPLLTRRTFMLGTSAALFTLAACSSRDSSPSPDTGDTRRISGKLGTAEVPDRPQRVVSVGQYRDTDAAVALGVIPLLSPDLSTFISGGTAPWIEQELGGKELNTVDVSEMPYETISSLTPDLILATDRQNPEEEYTTLSQIAPTLSWENGYNKDDWVTTTTRIGEALGKTQEAEDQIRLTRQAVSQAKNDNPELSGLTFTFGPVQADGTVSTINSTDDASVRFLADLGLTLSPDVVDLPGSGIPGRAVVGDENLDLLDADIVILTYNTPEARTQMESRPLFQNIPAVKRGSYVALDLPTALAIGFPSALSIRYGLEKLVPALRDATP
jgi:iron complex transport system substrate-binding protein